MARSDIEATLIERRTSVEETREQLREAIRQDRRIAWSPDETVVIEHHMAALEDTADRALKRVRQSQTVEMWAVSPRWFMWPSPLDTSMMQAFAGAAYDQMTNTHLVVAPEDLLRPIPVTDGIVVVGDVTDSTLVRGDYYGEDGRQ